MGPDARAKPSRMVLRGARAFPVHDHDFAEVFWIEAGRADHLINGKRVALEAGDGAFVRPRDRHGFSSSAQGFVICNVAISASIWRELRKRYFPAGQSGWEPDADFPKSFKLGGESLRGIRVAFESLVLRNESRMETEWFFLNLWRELRMGREEFAGKSVPRWLAEACHRLEDPDCFVQGSSVLARLAGRCPEHVARVVRRTCGKTPTDLFNEARLRHAAQQLLLTDRKVLDISMECGFSSLAHFYEVFGARFHMPPRQFRIRNHAMGEERAA